jgi:hypothetical protein
MKLIDREDLLPRTKNKLSVDYDVVAEWRISNVDDKSSSTALETEPQTPQKENI